MARDPEAMIASRSRALRERTGKSPEAWAALLDASLPEAPFADRVGWLVSTHGLTESDARTLTHLAAYLSRPPDDELVDAQYAGAKAALRPVYDAVVAAVVSLGDDVAIAPRRTYVTLARSRQFGLIQASTRARVDLGLRLDAEAPTERLAPAGSFGSGSITHRVGLASPADVDDELRAWIRTAYDGAA